MVVLIHERTINLTTHGVPYFISKGRALLINN